MTPIKTQNPVKTEALFRYLEKQKENKQFIRSIELASTLLLISFFALVAVYPTFTIISGLMGDIKAKQLMSTQMSRKIASILEAQDTFAQIQDTYKIIDSCFPSTPSFAHTADQLILSGNNNTTIDRLGFEVEKEKVTSKITKEKVDNSNGSSYEVSTTIKSEYYPAITYLQKLQNNRRIFDINSFSISVPKKQSAIASSSASQLNISLNTSFYYLAPKNEKK